MIKLRILIIVFLLGNLFSSCKDSHTLFPEVDINGSKVDLLISIKLHNTEEVSVKSRATSFQEIQNVDALVFDENKQFLSREKVEEINYTEGVYKFKIQLSETRAPRYVHLIANGHDLTGDRIDFSILQPGVNESVISQLTTNELTLSTVESIAPTIMWGKLNFSSVQNGTKIPTVMLIRSSVMIDVGIGDGMLNETSDFELLAVSAHNASGAGHVTPVDFSTSEIVPNDANIVFGPSPISYVDNNGHGYWVTSINNMCKGLQIYEAEGENKETPPERNKTKYLPDGDGGISFIIKANYKGELCFYKVVPYVDDYAISFVRNHRYIMKIVKVEGKGYATIEDAMLNPPGNLVVTIYDRNEGIVNSVTGGGRFLGTTLTELNLFTNTLDDCRLFDVITDDSESHISVYIESPEVQSLLRLESTLKSDWERKFIVKGTTLNPFIAKDESMIIIRNEYETLQLNIPLVIDPLQQIEPSKRLKLITKHHYKEWTLNLKSTISLASLLNVYKNNMQQEGTFYKGGENDEIELQLANNTGESNTNSNVYLYAELGGISLAGRVFHKLFVIRCSL